MDVHACRRACVCVRGWVRTKTAPGAGMSLSGPSMPAVFWMTHGPHAHRVGSCSPGWSGESATLAHAIDPCIRVLGSTVQRADGRCTGGTLAAAHGKDTDARTHALPESESERPAVATASAHQLEVDERERNRDRRLFGRVDPAANPRMCDGRLRMRARQRVPVRVRVRRRPRA